MPSAALYKDEGVSDFTLSAALRMLEAQGYDCDCINAVDIHNGALKNCDLFVMPGGADEPYHAKLGDEGAAIIRDFVVKDGGAYLGICAGAYYACDSFEFNKGFASEICRERPLKLFKGWAKGSLVDLAPPYDLTLDSAAMAWLNVFDDNMKAQNLQNVEVYYHGGPVFLRFDLDADYEVLATYNDVPANENAAIIARKFPESGGRVVLASPHFEVEAEDFAKRLELESHPQQYDMIYNDLQQLTTGRAQLVEKIIRFLRD